MFVYIQHSKWSEHVFSYYDRYWKVHNEYHQHVQDFTYRGGRQPTRTQAAAQLCLFQIRQRQGRLPQFRTAFAPYFLVCLGETYSRSKKYNGSKKYGSKHNTVGRNIIQGLCQSTFQKKAEHERRNDAGKNTPPHTTTATIDVYLYILQCFFQRGFSSGNGKGGGVGVLDVVGGGDIEQQDTAGFLQHGHACGWTNVGGGRKIGWWRKKERKKQKKKIFFLKLSGKKKKMTSY